MDDAVKFCGNLGEMQLYFIIDQINALENEGTNADLVSNSQKKDLWAFLQKITVGHYSITGASANYRTFQCMAWKQTGEVKMLMMGGMSKVRNSPFWMPCLLISIASVSQLEMKQWWVHYKGKLPILRESLTRIGLKT
jgi:hypothetical protein